MGLSLTSSAPCVERVIERQTVLEEFVVIGKERGQSKGYGEEARGLRCEIQARGISTTDNDGKLIQCWIAEFVPAQEGVKTTKRPDMRQLDIGNIVRRRAGGGRHGEDIAGGDIEEFRRGIDKARHQPGAGKTIDLRALSGNPLHNRKPRQGRGFKQCGPIPTLQER
jgi:hypothetical protein